LHFTCLLSFGNVDSSTLAGVKIRGYRLVDRSEFDLEKAIAEVGLAALTLDAKSKTFQ